MSNYGVEDRMPDSSPHSHRKKRRRIEHNIHSSNNNIINNDKNNSTHLRWRSQAEQRTYSTKLIEALKQVRRRNSIIQPSPSPSPQISGSRAVRDAADKALAIAAKGRTRWSRAILTNRMKLRLKNHKKAKVRSKVPSLPPLPPSGTSRGSGEKVPGVEKRVKVLGRLVPGCKKLSFPNLLEEATDYIAALQMQVRTMAALAELLSGSSTSSAGSMDVEPDISNDGDHNNPVQ